MEFIDIAVSSRRASDLLGVHESTIKRWCNSGMLACESTAGGHRRIAISTLVTFARENDIPFELTPFGEYAGAVWNGYKACTQSDDFGTLSDLVHTWMEESQSVRIAELFRYLAEKQIGFATIFDRILVAAMHRIGDGYIAGTISIGDEHRMTQVLRDALILTSGLRSQLSDSRPREEFTAIVGCAAGEAHELGSLMARFLLESHDWNVVYLGSNVPTEEFAAQQVKYEASLICISLSPPKGLSDVRNMVNLFERVSDDEHPFRLAFGGGGLETSTDPGNRLSSDLEVCLFSRLQDFENWLQSTDFSKDSLVRELTHARD